MIKSDVIKLNKIAVFDNDYIEREFAKLSINPVRWAVVDMDEDFLYVSVSYISI